MGRLADKMVTFDQFCLKAKDLIFGYDKVEPMDLLNVYDDMVEKAEEADKMATKLMLELGVPQSKIDELDNMEIHTLDDVIEERVASGTITYIKEGFEKKSLKKDGYCLKENVKGTAVQLRNDETMLGFISDTVEGTSRFVMVDFGDADGAVKIDIEELIF